MRRCGPKIARKVVTLFRKTPVSERPAEALTPQELRLLQPLADGHSYQAAAERLAISVNTVRSYVRNVYDKLHVHSKSEAVSKALRSGLISDVRRSFTACSMSAARERRLLVSGSSRRPDNSKGASRTHRVGCGRKRPRPDRAPFSVRGRAQPGEN